MIEAPAWFRQALAAPRTDHFVEVAGCPIHYLRWGDGAKPGLILVHGGAAHAQWWSFLAPLLTRQYDVVALDLSGHGDSGRRAEYPRRQWADEVMAVIADARFVGAPVLVGHSMGGLVSIVAASLYGDALAGAIIVDAPVRKPDPESQEGEAGKSFRNPKIYPTLEKAIAHFRLVPPQPCENAFIIDHIARTSLRARGRRLHVEVRSARVRQVLAREDERLPREHALPRRAPARRAQRRRAARDGRVHVRAPEPHGAARRDPARRTTT